MATLGDIHDAVSEELQKGSTLDAVIPGYVRRAALWLESNYSFKHTERYADFTLSAGARSVGQPPRLIAIRRMRYADEDGLWQKLKQVDPEEVLKNEEGYPAGYWLDGREYIWFDNYPEDDLTIELIYRQLTEWPSATGSTNFWTLEGEQLLVYQTLMGMAGRVRELELAQVWKVYRDEALQALQNMDQRLVDANREEFMNYAVQV